MARLSIFDRLAQQLYGDPDGGVIPPATNTTTAATQTAVSRQTPVSQPVFDFAPDKTIQEVVEESEGAAAGEPGVTPPPTVTTTPGGTPPPGGGKDPGTPKYKIVGNPPNLSVIQAEDGTWTNLSAAQSEASRRNTEWTNANTDTGVPSPPPPVDTSGQGGTEEGDETEEFDAREWAQENYTWLTGELLEKFLDVYDTNGGDAQDALKQLRTTDAYKQEFQGIFRDDGKTLRFEGDQPELQYIKMKEDFYDLLADYNLNPEYFNDKIVKLFENDVDPEKFERRLSVAYNTLFPQFDAVKQYYVENYPNVFPTTEDITDEAIFASFIDEDVSADIISQRVNISQIGGAFKEQDFAISKEQAQRLLSAGLTGTGAQQIAQRAEASLGRLQRISQRFTGRDDIFGLSEYIESEVFGEGAAQRLRERLEAEQATVFTQEGGAAVTQAGVTGLIEA